MSLWSAEDAALSGAAAKWAEDVLALPALSSREYQTLAGEAGARMLTITGHGPLAQAVRTCCAETHIAPDLLWICDDVPLDGVAIMRQTIAAYLRATDPVVPVPVLVSSQLPVGSIRQLEADWPGRSFAYAPENVRSAHAVQDFRHQARIVVGTRDTARHDFYCRLFAPFTSRVILTDPETAEVVKHAVNGYLGLCLVFINEMARLAQRVGADMPTISQALLSERRVSPEAPLWAGAFDGAHFQRDVGYVLAGRDASEFPLLRALKEQLDANAVHAGRSD